MNVGVSNLVDLDEEFSEAENATSDTLERNKQVDTMLTKSEHNFQTNAMYYKNQARFSEAQLLKLGKKFSTCKHKIKTLMVQASTQNSQIDILREKLTTMQGLLPPQLAEKP